MAKNSIRDFDNTAANNTDIQSVDVSEGCPASGINNALREIMADLADVNDGTVALETPAADRLDVDNIRIDGNTISSTDTNGNVVIDPDGTGSVGINVASPTSQLTIGGNANTIAKPTVQVTDTTAGASLTLRGQSPKLMFDITSSGVPKVLLDGAGIEFKDGTLDAEGNVDVKIGSTGNLMVGKTTDDATTVGVNIRSDKSFFTSDAKEALVLNRNTSDGKIIEFRKDNNTAGDIRCFGTRISLSSQGGDGSLSNAGTESYLWSADAFYPNTDDDKDLGLSIRRYDNIYATNTSIQTSDQTEKQQIASLTAAEITAAKALSKLFKTFKWNSAVADKGDAARTHTGHIAQEVQTAMTDAGLDAADYAFWCSDTYWEAAGTTYATADEAPQGATQRTRLGLRYSELLAFIGAATEQRLADIETRLTALEA